MNMKKAYMKPKIAVENFMLSEYIASCDPSFGNNVDDVIQALKGFFGIFNTEYSCMEMAQPGEEYPFGGQSICYHTSTRVVFSS